MATMEYKCPSCGAPLSFNPEKQNFACDYCGSEFTVQHIQSLYAQSEKTESINEQEVRQSEEQRAQAQKTGNRRSSARRLRKQAENSMRTSWCPIPVRPAAPRS